MNFAIRPLASAMLAAAIPLASVAGAQASQAPAPPAVHRASTATGTSVAAGAPEDWIVYDKVTYAPVVDDVSRHLAAARKALVAKNSALAAAELRTVAEELKRQAALAGDEEKSLARADKALVTADRDFAADTVRRMNTGAMKVSTAAAAVAAGKIRTTEELDKVIDQGARTDIDRRWLVAPVTVWFPAEEAPQRHFTDAVASFAKRDYKAAAADIRKANSYLRLASDRATGEAREELVGSIAQLDRLAASVESGAEQGEDSMTMAFAKANHALSLAHRFKAMEAWMRSEYHESGHELEAAAHELRNAAGWLGGAAQAGALATAADSEALGNLLVTGGTWSRDEVANGFKSLDNGIDALGRKIAGTGKAAPVDAGG
jgi:hypothetical protein